MWEVASSGTLSEVAHTSPAMRRCPSACLAFVVFDESAINEVYLSHGEASDAVAAAVTKLRRLHGQLVTVMPQVGGRGAAS